MRKTMPRHNQQPWQAAWSHGTNKYRSFRNRWDLARGAGCVHWVILWTEVLSQWSFALGGNLGNLTKCKFSLPLSSIMVVGSFPSHMPILNTCASLLHLSLPREVSKPSTYSTAIFTLHSFFSCVQPPHIHWKSYTVPKYTLCHVVNCHLNCFPGASPERTAEWPGTAEEWSSDPGWGGNQPRDAA